LPRCPRWARAHRDWSTRSRAIARSSAWPGSPARRRRQGPEGAGAGESVVLLIDPHTAWYEPEIGEAAVGVLERLGLTVHPTRPASAGRPAISQGALHRARRELAELVDAVARAGPPGVPVIGLEPSELLTLRDEAPDLVPPESRAAMESLAGRALLLEEWLTGAGAAAFHAAISESSGAAGAIAVHVHCHAKSLVGVEPFRNALAALPGAQVEVIDSGCCGMAGVFGYRSETAEFSRGVAELSLAPAVRARPRDTLIAAPGVSCRQQIRHVTGREAVHPVEAIARALGADTRR